MTTYYFLGANTPDGFYSLYDKYIRDNDRLYIIKGSPGCGKSTFMKKLAEKMSEIGTDTELIYCSGDPDSLDGVYFPELHTAYVDGTAPHVIEPVYAGVRENYLNFGDGLDMDGLWEHKDTIKALNRKYKAEYKKAYSSLQVARTSQLGLLDELITDNVREAVEKRAVRLCKKEFKKMKTDGSVKERFVDAFTCNGWIHRYDTIVALAEKIYLIDTAFGLNYLFNEAVAKIAVENNWNVILCRDAFCPDKISHVLVPQAGIAIVSRYGNDFPEWNVRTIRLDSLPSKNGVRLLRRELSLKHKIYEAMLADSINHLAGAKAYHDELEQTYRPYADFSIADSLLEKHIKMLIERSQEL